MKKLTALVMALVLMLTACSFAFADGETVADIIAQAQNMSNAELYAKAIEESRGQVMYGIGNSSRGKTAGASFIEMLQGIDPTYDGTIEWSQPKNNTIFEELTSDHDGTNHIYAMTLIQDGNQIQSKMLDTGVLLNYIPKDWKEAEGCAVEGNDYPLTLQTLNKVFMFNNVDGTSFKNCWDFVAYEGVNPLFMGVNSELVGKNFLYMLTNEKYANYLKDAFDALPAEDQAVLAPMADMMEEYVTDMGLTAENAKYALLWIYLWCDAYNEQTDDGPICNTLVTKSAAGQCGLLVYSKLRSVEETDEASKNNITVAAYQDDYVGIGGYAYKHFLMVTETSPLPWTACAFIAYMTCEAEGFKAWGKDMGGYAPNPAVMQDHSQDGYVDGVNTFDCKNDRGYEWWINEGKLVVEDPAYCASVSSVMGDWIDAILADK